MAKSDQPKKPIVLTEEALARFRPHIVVNLGGKRYELNPPKQADEPAEPTD